MPSADLGMLSRLPCRMWVAALLVRMGVEDQIEDTDRDCKLPLGLSSSLVLSEDLRMPRICESLFRANMRRGGRLGVTSFIAARRAACFAYSRFSLGYGIVMPDAGGMRSKACCLTAAALVRTAARMICVANSCSSCKAVSKLIRFSKKFHSIHIFPYGDSAICGILRHELVRPSFSVPRTSRPRRISDA